MSRAALRAIEVEAAKAKRAPRRCLRFVLADVLKWLDFPVPDGLPEILTVADLATKLHVSRSWIYDAILRGMPHVDLALRDRGEAQR